ncbi:chemotaxis protein [Rhodoferax lacus]|uniref:Chemotaxis protein n=1 Tax=Rhodoferax lacus TaxID=2184758 RepID=A0A3E1RBF7_9BURK|nr:PAS domain-containing methyl-accepting chemotaxis protein [Rhodoferax lacus]RFO96695.1 chemotaxis protein [Rhodoferax lacus]
MRSNLPVSQRPFEFPRDQTLVSVTDLKGRITYCNAAFTAVSGYSQAELLGQPHNLVRHPDMPEEAFRDMWATIQSKRPWTGLVKNRRKDGDHYWVNANATPMLDGDQITGYLSVRTCPTREAVAAAEALYADMQADVAAGRSRYALHHGQVLRTGLVGALQRLLKPNVLSKMATLQVLLALAVLGLLLLGTPLALVALAMGCWAAVTVAATWFMAVQPLMQVVDDANHLASGDLAHAVATGAGGFLGQLQQALNQMSVNLRTVVSDVRQEVDALNISVREIADGNEDLSSRTESQASSLQQTAASMEEINSTVQSSAASAMRGHELAGTTTHITQRSNEAVHAVAQSMQGIADSAGKINEIIQLIEGVAFQTNILALNAAVEAARAGDQGRGFAVVAAEVRALAQRTTAAAKDIRQLISESAQRVDTGDQQTKVALGRMESALQAVGKVSTVLEEISTASNEQQLGISQINEAITQMDSLTQQNAAMVEELAATARSMQGQAGEVSNSMRLFRLKAGDLTVAQTDAVGLRRLAKA